MIYEKTMNNDTSKNFITSTHKEIHLRDYLQILQKRKNYILIFLLITFFSTLAWTLTATPKFKATTQLLIQQNSDINLINNISISPNDPRFYETQYEIIKSRHVINRVIDKLQLDERYETHFLGKEKSLLQNIKKKLTSILPDKNIKSSDDYENSFHSPITNKEKNILEINKIISNNLYVQPDKKTHIVNISYTDKTPFLAERITNSIARCYKDELLEI